LALPVFKIKENPIDGGIVHSHREMPNINHHPSSFIFDNLWGLVYEREREDIYTQLVSERVRMRERN